jgi:lipid II isoglutaminyl synthase (glutamine-hydrolysing)
MVFFHIFLIYVLKLIKRIIILTKLGSGTSLPGIVIEQYYPALITFMAKKYKTIILITGTNGKTTTLHAIHTILHKSQVTLVSNLSGANIMRGIATALINDFSPRASKQFAIFEVEEATMPKLTKLLSADYIVITNIFRDQLDVYGEVNKTLDYMEKACNNNPRAQIILNTDDPLLNKLSRRIKNELQPYSLGKYAMQFDYEGLKSYTPLIDIYPVNVKKISILEDGSTMSALEIQTSSYTIKLLLPGIYNVYNIIASITTTLLIGIPVKRIVESVQNVKAVFGRGEVINVQNAKNNTINIRIFLIKNPAGLGQVLQTINYSHHRHLVFALNDNIADGRDVSWIWDAKMRGIKARRITTTGTRALDMALRIKYDHTIVYNELLSQPDLKSCIKDIIAQEDATPVTILANYTSMNTIRTILGEFTHLKTLA